ncbi:hypothetical protein JCM16418A_31130 [Paenibacillus pini]
MGKAIAELYAKEGAKVIVADLNIEGAEEVAQGIINNGGVAKALQVNVAKLEDIENMIDTAVSEYGTLDVLVNNAGIMYGFEAVGEVNDERWDLVFDINTKSVMRSIRKALPIFLEKGVGSSEEIAKVALFLASEDSSFVNGTVITADAGWTSAF